jgi:hypothetical protein
MIEKHLVSEKISHVSKDRILRQNPDQSLTSLLLPIHRQLFGFAWKPLFLQTHAAVQLFVPLKYDQDLNPYPHRSALVWLPGSGSGFALRKESWIRIRIRIHIEIKADL